MNFFKRLTVGVASCALIATATPSVAHAQSSFSEIFSIADVLKTNVPKENALNAHLRNVWTYSKGYESKRICNAFKKRNAETNFVRDCQRYGQYWRFQYKLKS